MGIAPISPPVRKGLIEQAGVEPAYYPKSDPIHGLVFLVVFLVFIAFGVYRMFN